MRYRRSSLAGTSSAEHLIVAFVENGFFRKSFSSYRQALAVCCACKTGLNWNEAKESEVNTTWQVSENGAAAICWWSPWAMTTRANRIKPKQKTVHPPEGLTPKQKEKWLKEQAVLFERECKGLPQEVDRESITLAKYTELWLREPSPPASWPSPRMARDRQDIDRFLPVLGHYKLTELRPEHFRQLLRSACGK